MEGTLLGGERVPNGVSLEGFGNGGGGDRVVALSLWVDFFKEYIEEVGSNSKRVSRPVAPATAKFMPAGLAVAGLATGFDTDGEIVFRGVSRRPPGIVIPWGFGL